MKHSNRKIWLISDTHFFHEKRNDIMTRLCGRPKNYSNLIIQHWNKMIADNDLVYHLGDVYFGKRSEFLKLLTNLTGIKVLIKGNHDRESTQWYLNHGFECVVDQIMLTTKLKIKHGQMQKYKIILSHKPIKLDPEQKFLINIHGHFHNNNIKNCEPELIKNLTPNHYLFSIENTGYKPVLLTNLFYGELIKGD
jgi:calcineurin-like phosphoesterase family protein